MSFPHSTDHPNFIHGYSQPSSPFFKLWQVWRDMLRRCYVEKFKYYHRYGGRGIKVCQRWIDSVDDFIKDMGPMPTAKHTLDRKDNNGNYCPENCLWATRKEQARNRRDTRMIAFNGKTQCVSDWAREYNINRKTLYTRLARPGWSIERAITEAPSHCRRRDQEVC